MTASQAAQALLESLGTTAGAVAVWPLTRNNTLTLVVRIQGRMRSSVLIPSSFEGFPVIVEAGGPVPSQRENAAKFCDLVFNG